MSEHSDGDSPALEAVKTCFLAGLDQMQESLYGNRESCQRLWDILQIRGFEVMVGICLANKESTALLREVTIYGLAKIDELAISRGETR